MQKLVRNIIAFALLNKQAVGLLMILLMLAGSYAYLHIPVESFPDVAPPRVVIITQWSGRSAEEVEKFVTVPLEVELNSVPKKTSLRSISLYGLSVVTLFFEDNQNELEAQQQVALRIANANIPDGVSPEIQPSAGPTGEIYRYTIHSSEKNARQLKTIQDWVLDREFKSVPGVADVVSFGGEVKTYEVSVDPKMLMRYNLTALDVYQAVSKCNINVGGDVIVKADQSFVVRGIGLLNSISELENVIVSQNKVPILVKHLATVRESNLQPLGYVGRDAAKNLVEGIILLRRGENPTPVLDAIRAKVLQLNSSVLPKDVRIEPFYDRSNLINHTTKTVTHNTLEGILLVVVVVFAFLLEWRSSLIIACIIPLSLMFAFYCLNALHMSANLLSLGAIDFGIIIDGSVVMVEGLFVVLANRAEHLGQMRFGKSLKSGLIVKHGAEIGKNILVAQAIIVAALLPVFLFEKVEGRMFSPLAWTMGFALLGALICTLTFVPMMVHLLLRQNIKEAHNVVVEWLVTTVLRVGHKLRAMPKRTLTVALMVVSFGLYTFVHLGTEFLPQLNEGAIYIRASMPLSSSLNNSIATAEQMRHIIGQFKEVKQVLSQTGRPNDGTDPTGFFNIEFHVDLNDLKTEGYLPKAVLIDSMKRALAVYRGVNLNFSQPIMDNVEEAVSGVKGSMAVKVYGNDIAGLERDAQKVYGILKTINGVEDLGIIPITGQPEIRIDLNQTKMAQMGINVADCQTIIEMAVGGKAANLMYEAERRYAIRIRYLEEYRNNEEKLRNLMIPTMDGKKVPLSSIADVRVKQGVAFLYHEGNQRFAAVKFSVRGRDLGSTIEEAKQKVEAAFPPSYQSRIAWNGEFENQQRATTRLSQTIPLALLIVFLLLLTLTNHLKDSLMILANIPFALVGGILSLHFTGINFSISAGIGFVALLGICVQNGVILLSQFRKNQEAGLDLATAITEAVRVRTRPVVMTALIAAIGLTPAALSTGIGSETQKPLAIVVIGGLISATILTLLIFPVLFEYANRRGKVTA